MELPLSLLNNYSGFHMMIIQWLEWKEAVQGLTKKVSKNNNFFSSCTNLCCLVDGLEVETREMMNRLGPEVYPKWELFAIELGIASGIIESISRKKLGDDQMCFYNVLVKWRNSPPPEYPFMMESAVRILRKPIINLRMLAAEIEQELEQTPN